jgi:hypothetical protein
VPPTNLQVVSVALHGRIADEVVEVRVVTQGDMPAPKRDTCRVVAVSLYEPEAREADRLTDVLKRAGWPKANRSLIVREALLLLGQDLAGKDDEGVFRDFIERLARRLGPSRSGLTPPRSKSPEPNLTQDNRTPRDLLDLSERKQ